MLFDANRLLTEVRIKRLSGLCGQDRRPIAERLVAETAELAQRTVRGASLLELADAWLPDEPSKAINYSKQARALVREATEPNLAALSLAIEADALLQQDPLHANEAHDLMQRAVGLARRQRNRVNDPILRATSMRDRIRIFEGATRAALAAGRLDSALEAAEHARPSLPEEQPLVLEAVRDAINVGELGIVYTWLDPQRLLVAVIEREGLAAVEVQVSSEALLLLETLSAHLRNGRQDGWSFTPAEAEGLNILTPALLPPFVNSRLAHARKLFILPHRALHAVPFGLLRVGETRLGLRFPWTAVPNLAAVSRAFPVAAKCGLIASGIDRYPGLRSTRGFGDSAERVVAVHHAHGLPARCLADPGAYEAFLELAGGDELETSAFLLLACHGTSVQGDTPGESFLQFGAKRLTADTLAAFRIPADLVVLVACCSGQRAVGGMGIHFWPGDDLFGLQAAFWRAGARQVIGALWNADIRAASTMPSVVHDAWLNGADAAECVHAAAVRLDADAFHHRNHDWATFSAVQFGRNLQRSKAR